MTKFPGEICIVAKAGRVGDLADRLACAQQLPAMQEARGVIQTKRIDEFTAGRTALGKQLLQITQRNPRFHRYLARTEVWIGKAILDDIADSTEQLVIMKRGRHRIWRCKQCSEKIIDRQLHVVAGWRGDWILVSHAFPNELIQQSPCSRLGATAKASLRFESEVGHQGRARQL